VPDPLTTPVARNEPTENPVWIHQAPEASNALAASTGPLAGLRFAVKDNIDVAGMPTTAGCAAYAYQPSRSATAVQKLLDAGAACAGKTNLDQFATGLSGMRSPYGECRNAFNPDYISGGSSSGSALAVALGMADFALGTDTAGSGRVPAAFNNVVGLKPTRGLVSTSGVVPACRSLDCISVFAKSCARALSVLEVMKGYDPADPYSRHENPVCLESRNLRVAVPRDPEFYGDAAYASLFAQSLEKLGGARVPVDFTPFLAAQQLLYDGPWLAERTAQLQAFMRQHAGEMHPVVREVIAGGNRYSAVDAFQAQYRLAALRRDTESVWEAADVLVVPGAPTIYTRAEMAADPVALNARLGLYTNFVNLLDLAAITVPAGFRPDGIPFGITLIGPAFSDRALAALGARFLGEADIPMPATTVRVAVVGAHLSGMPLNGQLVERAAKLVRSARTSPSYRLYDLADGRPGLVRENGSDGHGDCIDVEVWEMPHAGFGSFVAQIPPPLGIGTLDLEDGERVKGFVCENYAVAGKRDITSFGGWRRFVDADPNSK